MLWNLRLRDRFGIHVVVIEAADFSEADAVGRAHCEALNAEFVRFIRIDGPMVVATPDILNRPQLSRDPEPPPADKPSLDEQRARIARRNSGTSPAA